MRPLPALLVLALAAPAAFAETPISLSPGDVKATLAPYADTLEHCYLDHTANVYGAGKLSVELTVTRKGELKTLAIKTPGLETKIGMKVAGCIADTLDGVTFPARRGVTTATVPYFFQRTAAAGAGPYESCWDAKGCPSADRTASHAAKQNRYARGGWRVARHGSSSRSRPSRHADASASP